MHPNKDPTYYSAGRYLNQELRQRLSKRLGKPIPYPTLKRWRKHLNMQPDDYGRYTESDLDGLTDLGKWLKRGGKAKPFADLYLQFINSLEV